MRTTTLQQCRRSGWRKRSAAVGVVAALVFAGCSSSGKASSSSPGSTSGSTAGPGAKPTGSPIKVMIAGIITSPTLNLPEQAAAGKAEVANVNAHGGVNGHPIDAHSM